jgi:uncharacterized protein involved in exopolysaccharide biosynthesis
VVGVVVVAIISLKLPSESSPFPNTYTAQAQMVINDTSSQGGALASMISSGSFGGIAALAGGRGLVVASTPSAFASQIIKNNVVLDAITDNFDIIKRYGIKKYVRTESRNLLKGLIKTDYDKTSGIFSIIVTDVDPVFAQALVNFCVDQLEKRFKELGLDKTELERKNLEKNIENAYIEMQRLEQESRQLEQLVSRGSVMTIPAITLERNRIAVELAAQQQVYTQLKVQFELTKVRLASETPTFQIIQYADVPEIKSGPHWSIICVAVTFIGFLLATVFAFILNAIANIRKDPDAMAKLRGDYEK